MSSRLIHLLFFASGLAGLVYQVVWVREFGNLFGNTVHSAAVVTTLFMLGLGLGGLVAGIIADRLYRRRPGSLLSAYGAVEIGIALCGQAIAAVLPTLGPLTASWRPALVGSDGWLRPSTAGLVATYGLTVLLLLPVTTLMGATLTLLIRHAVRSDVSQSGRRVGSLYGINTAGAAAGALLVDAWLVPNLGLAATESVAVLINLSIGLTVLVAIHRRRPTIAVAEEQPARIAETSAPAPLITAGAAITLAGFVGMGLEIVWFRHLVSALGGHRATFSLLLTVILCGIWFGSAASGALSRRVRSPAMMWAAVQALLAIIVLITMARFSIRKVDPAALAAVWQAADGAWRPVIATWSRLAVILQLVGPGAVLLGASYPLANAHAQRLEAAVGTRAGLLYLANTVGAVAGALLTGFVLLPDLGTQRTVALLAAASTATALLLLAAGCGTARRGARATAAATVLVALVVITLWSQLPADFVQRASFRPIDPNERLLDVTEGPAETVWVSENPDHGLRRLYTNGHSMSATGYPAQRYMRAFAHLPLLMTETPRRVLVIGFGVGSTTHAASLHPSIERIDVADVSENVLRHARFFAASNHHVLADPRVRVFVNDGRQHLRSVATSYDLVTLEPPPLAHAGVGALYSTEFYRLARAALAPGGFVTQWLPAHQVPPEVTASLVRSFVAVFPEGVVVSGYGTELILVGRAGASPRFDLDDLRRRLADRPAVAADLAAVDLATPTELVGTFIGGPAALARTAALAPPLTDDWPIMEYDTLPFPSVLPGAVPRDLFEPAAVAVFCPTCFTAAGPCPEVADLPTYLAAATAFALAPGEPPPPHPSGYLKHLYRRQ